MGDRVSVSLSIPTAVIDRAEKIIGKRYVFEHSGLNQSKLLTKYLFDEINCGDLVFLPNLVAAGIPYNSLWESGYGFEAGGEYCRYTPDGTPIIKRIFASEVNPDFSKLLQIIDTPAELKVFLRTHQEKTEVLPWDNQVIFGKHHITKRLLKDIE